MTLRDSIGVRFSELRDNHQKDVTFWWNRFMPGLGEYREAERPLDRYGDLPDGGRYGIGYYPNWADPWTQDGQYVVTGPDGELKGLSGQINHGHWWVPSPDALVATPDGDALVWLEEGQLWFWPDDEWGYGDCWSGNQIVVPHNVAIADARMNADDTLDVWCADDTHYVFACHERVLLLPDGRNLLLCMVSHGAASEREGWLDYGEVISRMTDLTGAFIDKALDIDTDVLEYYGPHLSEVRFFEE